MVERVLLGRTAELERIAAWIRAIAAGPQALTLEGEAGIGKTALWTAALHVAQGDAAPAGLTVLIARASEAERSLPHVVLTDLLGPIGPAAMASLPGPQAAALGAALLLDSEPPDDPAALPRAGDSTVEAADRSEAAEMPEAADTPEAADPRAIGTAVLGVLRWATRDGPLLLGIDDVQWIDAASDAALGFALRRAVAAGLPVGVLMTRRLEGSALAVPAGTGAMPDRSPLAAAFGEAGAAMTVRPVSLGVLHQLIRERTGAILSRPRLARLEAASGGNPLLAIEIGRELGRLDHWPLPGEPLPIPADIRVLVARRMERLPAAGIDVLFVTAALAEPTIPAVAQALGLPESEVREVARRAADTGLLEAAPGDRPPDDVLRFGHPTMEAAALAAPTVDRRLVLRRRLAALATTDEDRGRHIALAVEGPDPDAAAALDRAAAAARRRGAPGVAAAWQDSAADLTPPDDVEGRRRRTLRAARWWTESGEVDRGRAGLEALIAEAPPGNLRAEARAALAQIVAWNAGPAAMQPIAEAALAEATDPELRARTLLRLAIGADHLPAAARSDYADAAVETLRGMRDREPDPDLLACALLQSASMRFDAGIADDQAAVDAAIALLDDEPRAAGDSDGGTEGLRAHALVWEWADDHDRSDDALDGALGDLDRARARGQDRPLPIIETEIALLLVRAGRWDEAAGHAQAALAAADLAGNLEGRRAALGGLAAIALVRGELGQATALLARAEPAGEGDDDWLETRHRAIAGSLALVRGEAPAAAAILGTLLDEQVALGRGETLQYRFAGDLVEAALAAGDLERARTTVDVLIESVERRPRPWVRLMAARSSAMTAAAEGDLDGAELAMQAALGHAASLPMPLEVARTELVAGRIARRRKERRRAAMHFDRAIEGFRGLGAAAWLAIAEDEVARIGRRASRSDALTETELQVARLAASGLTNREVGEIAFLTAKSVEGVLARVYPKLGIRSRAELGAWLVAGQGDVVAKHGDGIPPFRDVQQDD